MFSFPTAMIINSCDTNYEVIGNWALVYRIVYVMVDSM